MEFDALFRQMIENTQDLVTLYACGKQGSQPQIMYVNPAFEQRMGYGLKDLQGKSFDFFYGPATELATRRRISRTLREAHPLRIEIQKYTQSGQTLWLDMNLIPLKNRNGRVTHFAAIERDLTHYKSLERELAKMALFDSLTGALSRSAFFQQASKEFTRARRYHRPLSVIMLDIDHFKKINDRYGHSAGDYVLQIFVEAIQDVIRSTDFLGRIGGEEFALLLPDSPLAAAHMLAERVRERIIRYPYLAGEMLIEVTCSLGVAELVKEDKEFKVLLARADDALYRAKQQGRNQVQLAA